MNYWIIMIPRITILLSYENQLEMEILNLFENIF